MKFSGLVLGANGDDDGDDERFTVVRAATFRFFVGFKTTEAGNARFFDKEFTEIKLGASDAPCLAVVRTLSS